MGQFVSKVKFSPLLFVSSVFIASQLLYFLCYLTLFYFGNISSNVFENMCRWDCYWYLSIIIHGYDSAIHPEIASSGLSQANWAFFPLFPLVGRVILSIFHNKLSVVIFNQILFFFSLLLLFRYCVKQYSSKIAIHAVLLLGFSFVNIYISSVYTESLFLFLSLLVMNLISDKKYIFGGIGCAFISATRLQGAVMLFPVLFNFMMNNQFKINYRNCIWIILLSLLSLSGLFVFMIYLHQHVDDYVAFLHIQNAWGRGGYSWMQPIEVLHGFRMGKPVGIFFVFLTFPSLYYFYKNKKWNEFIFLFGCFFMVFLSQNFNSYARFAVGNYCLYIYLATLMQGWWRSFFVAIPTLLLYIHFLCMWLASPTHAYY